jgi:hypothetical protein
MLIFLRYFWSKYDDITCHTSFIFLEYFHKKYDTMHPVRVASPMYERTIETFKWILIRKKESTRIRTRREDVWCLCITLGYHPGNYKGQLTWGQSVYWRLAASGAITHLFRTSNASMHTRVLSRGGLRSQELTSPSPSPCWTVYRGQKPSGSPNPAENHSWNQTERTSQGMK